MSGILGKRLGSEALGHGHAQGLHTAALPRGGVGRPRGVCSMTRLCGHIPPGPVGFPRAESRGREAAEPAPCLKRKCAGHWRPPITTATRNDGSSETAAFLARAAWRWTWGGLHRRLLESGEAVWPLGSASVRTLPFLFECLFLDSFIDAGMWRFSKNISEVPSTGRADQSGSCSALDSLHIKSLSLFFDVVVPALFPPMLVLSLELLFLKRLVDFDSPCGHPRRGGV